MKINYPSQFCLAVAVSSCGSPQQTPDSSAQYTLELEVGASFQDTLSIGGEGPKMVVLPSGNFTMGSPDNEAGRFDVEGPQHTVRVEYEFAVGKYEVSWSEWEACVSDGGCDDNSSKKFLRDTPAKFAGDAGYGRGTRPVINVDWHDAQAYVSWLSDKTGQTYRLLSESEWEYAARAGTDSAYPWGASIGLNKANCTEANCADSFDKTSPVGSFPANRFGLHDMHGNVWEWTEDCSNGSYVAAPSDGSAWASGNCSSRVLRGGAWSSSDPLLLRSAYRLAGVTTEPGSNLGFRVARIL